MNRLILIGRISRDIELKEVSGGRSVTNNILAVNRMYKRNGSAPETDFIPFIAWGKRAEVLDQYCKKGDLIGLEGRLQSRSYQDSQGASQYVVEMVVDNIQFLETKKKQESFVSKEAETAKEAFV